MTAANRVATWEPVADAIAHAGVMHDPGTSNVNDRNRVIACRTRCARALDRVARSFTNVGSRLGRSPLNVS